MKELKLAFYQLNNCSCKFPYWLKKLCRMKFCYMRGTVIGVEEKMGYPRGGSADCTVKFRNTTGCAWIL